MLTLISWISRQAVALKTASVRRALYALAGSLLIVNVSAQTSAPPTLQLTSSAYSVEENAGSIRVPVRRFGNLNQTTTVVVTAAEVTARDGQDFVARTATLTFPTNSMEAFFDVVILDNDKTNVNKTFNITLSNPSNGQLGTVRQAQVQIIDDESGVAGISTGDFTFSAALYTATDYESFSRANTPDNYLGVEITIVRKNGSRGKALVDFSTGSGSAQPGVHI